MEIVTTLIWLSFSEMANKISTSQPEPFKRSEIVLLSEIGVWNIEGYTWIPCKHGCIKQCNKNGVRRNSVEDKTLRKLAMYFPKLFNENLAGSLSSLPRL